MEKNQRRRWHDYDTSRKTTTSILDNTTGACDAAAGTTPLGALAGHFKMGFEVVAVMKTERGAGPLAGTWEVWLKRKIHGRAGEKK